MNCTTSSRIKLVIPKGFGGRIMVSEAAYAVGYNSPKLFTCQLKEEFGITASELRRSDSQSS